MAKGGCTVVLLALLAATAWAQGAQEPEWLLWGQYNRDGIRPRPGEAWKWQAFHRHTPPVCIARMVEINEEAARGEPPRLVLCLPPGVDPNCYAGRCDLSGRESVR